MPRFRFTTTAESAAEGDTGSETPHALRVVLALPPRWLKDAGFRARFLSLLSRCALRTFFNVAAYRQAGELCGW